MIKKELSYLQFIYAQLDIKVPVDLVGKWQSKTNAKNHKKKTYQFSNELIAIVNDALGDRIEKMGYEKLEVTS